MSANCGLLGKYDGITAALKQIESDNDLKESLGINCKVTELLRYMALPTFGGAVFELRNVEIEEFESQKKFSS